MDEVDQPKKERLVTNVKRDGNIIFIDHDNCRRCKKPIDSCHCD